FVKAETTDARKIYFSFPFGNKTDVVINDARDENINDTLNILSGVAASAYLLLPINAIISSDNSPHRRHNGITSVNMTLNTIDINFFESSLFPVPCKAESLGTVTITIADTRFLKIL